MVDDDLHGDPLDVEFRYPGFEVLFKLYPATRIPQFAPVQSKIHSAHISPRRIEVFDHQSPMAVFGCRFATNQDGVNRKQTARHIGFDLAFDHQLHELPLTHIPAPFFFFVNVQDGLSGCHACCNRSIVTTSVAGWPRGSGTVRTVL